MNVLRTARKTTPFPFLLRNMSSTASKTPVKFGPFEVTQQVFLQTPHSFAVVNLKPLLPGHVLVCPTSPHKRLTDLTTPELTDLFTTVQRVQRMLARYYFPQTSHPGANTPEDGSFNIAIQDGAEAGQTVPHVHVHVIPRIRDATAKETSPGAGDELYERMASEEGNVGGALWDCARRPRAGGAFPPIEESERKVRGMEEMVEEARLYRRLLEDMDAER